MLQREAENVWTAEHELKIGGRVPFPTRMTAVRLPDGSLVLISPVPIRDALAAELASLGPVSYLVAPNNLHHLYLRRAHERYPEARLLAAPGVAAKQPALELEPLDFEAHAALRDVLALRPIEGAPKISEFVLFHGPSRSLVVTDLVFNIEHSPAWTTSLVLTLMGARGRLAQSRVWRFFAEDRAAARASSARLFDWDFERVIVAHGSNVKSDAKARLAAALTHTGPAEPARAPQLV